MNKTLKGLPIFLILAATLTLLFANMTYAQPPEVWVNPASLTDPSSPFTVDIDIDDVTDLYSWEFKLYYDNTILTISTVLLGPLLNDTVGTANTWGIIKDQTDSYNATHGRIWAAQSITGDRAGATVTTGTLATLTFTVDGSSGITPLSLEDTKLIGYNYATKTLSIIAHTTADGSVTISAVPEFPMGLTLEVALIVTIFYIWHRRKRKAPQFLQQP